MIYHLATREALRQHLGFAISDSGDDARLDAALMAASALIEEAARRRFFPMIAERRCDIDLRDRRSLHLPQDLLTLHSLINGDGQSIPLDAIIVLPGDTLLLKSGYHFVYDDSPLQALRVNAAWGWHEDGAAAWLSSPARLSTALDATSTDCSYTGDASLLQRGQLLRLGEEYAWLLAHDPLTQTLSLQRGAQGSSTSPHNTDSPFSIWQVSRPAQNLCLRWAAWLYQEPNSSQPQIPDALLQAVGALRRIRVAS